MPKSPTWSQEKYLEAYHFAAKAHRGQKYNGTGLPYLMHLSFVSMEIIAVLAVENVKDPNLALQCAVLHDVIEDTKVSKKIVEEVFGKGVASGVSLLSKNKKNENKEKRFSEFIDLLLDAPKEVIMVKLADRITNLQKPPYHWDMEKKKDYLGKSKVILEKLGNTSPYLSKRLKVKIENYKQYITS